MIERHSPYAGILHEAVVHGDTIHLSGLVAEDLSLDMAGQARDVLRQLDALLIAHGSDRDHVLQVTAYVTDLTEKGGFNTAWGEYFTERSLPARATIGVADLGPRVKIEIVATAAIRR